MLSLGGGVNAQETRTFDVRMDCDRSGSGCREDRSCECSSNRSNCNNGWDNIALNSPFPRPSSIKLLARFPRMPELLRLCLSALVLRISLLRLMTGVSAKGSWIRIIFSSSTPSAPFFRFFSMVTGRALNGLGDRSCLA